MYKYKMEFIGGILAGMMLLSGCSYATVTNKNPVTEFVQTPNGIPMESPLITNTPSPTEGVEGTIQIDLARAIYPPLSNVQENFEKGEYHAGLETIKQWVGVWEEMGVFKEIEVENNTLSPVPLDGRARAVCVDTRKQEEYVGTMLCPPLDLVNGGLKAVPENGKWDETDKPLLISFERTEELVTKGSGSELVYQFMDKYMDTQNRYFDPKTGQIVEGKSLVSDVEVVENEVIKGSIVCVSKEYCMNGQMEVDQEVGKVFYERFLNALILNAANKDYFNNLLNGDLSFDALKSYLDANGGIMPPGLSMFRWSSGRYIYMDNIIDRSLNLSALKTVTIGSREWQDDVIGIQGYVNEYKSNGLINPYSNGGDAWAYYGWMVDNNGYLVLVSGAKYPSDRIITIGGEDGEYVAERDNKIATAMLLSQITCMERYDKDSRRLIGLFPLTNEQNYSYYGANEKDVEELAGGRYLFVSTN